MSVAFRGSASQRRGSVKRACQAAGKARDTERMTRLSSRSEERDVLEALKASRRELGLSVQLERLLGSGGGRGMEAVRASGAEQIRERVTMLRRGRFRGPISLVIDLELPPVRNPIGLRRSVKGYIDLLWRQGDVLDDDAAIDHLIVLPRTGVVSEPTVTMLCTPISVFTSDFDRAMRIANEVWPEPDQAPPRFRDGAELEPDPAEWGRYHLSEVDRELLLADEELLHILDDLDAEMREQLAEDPDADVDYDGFSFDRELEDPDVRDNVRTALEPRAAEARARWLADQSIDAHDRPGPPPGWIAEVRRHDLADVLAVGDNTPGSFILPAPRDQAGTSKQWLSAVRSIFAQRIEEPQWRRARFPQPIALDIAIRGYAASFKDVDNRAAGIITQFEEAFASAEVVIGGYRVYRLPHATSSDIRVRILPVCRLRELASRLGQARAYVEENRRERTRGLDPP
jgi:hypothetical protein